MLVSDKDALRRLNASDNLINRLKNGDVSSKRNSAMSLFGIGKKKEEIINIPAAPAAFNPFPAKGTEPVSSETPAELPAPIVDNPNIDTILSNPDAQIKLKLAHDSALTLLTDSLSALSAKLPEVPAGKLPGVIAAASKTVESIRRERNEAAKNFKGNEVHFHFYTPEQKKLADYEVIDVPA